MRAFATLGLAMVVCACGPSVLAPPPTADENVASFVAATAGGAPVAARVAYDASTSCEPPDWLSMHPDQPEVTWPSFRVGLLVDVEVSHASVDTGRRVYTHDLHEGLETDGTHVLALHEWNGTEVPCGDELMSDGLVISGGYFFTSPQTDEVFAAKAAQVDSGGLTPMRDTDVAIPSGE